MSNLGGAGSKFPGKSPNRCAAHAPKQARPLPRLWVIIPRRGGFAVAGRGGHKAPNFAASVAHPEEVKNQRFFKSTEWRLAPIPR